MHIQEGDIRAYVDRELDPEKAALLESHLAQCPLCLEKYQAIQSRQQLLSNVFEGINITEPKLPIQTPVAWRTFQSKIYEDQKEKTNMWKNMQSRIPRLAWMAMAIVLILVVSLTFAPVRAIAEGDGFTIRAGCDKRMETCGEKFANTANFRGFPHIPGQDAVLRYATKDGGHEGGVL